MSTDLTRTLYTIIRKNPKYDTFLDVAIVWEFDTCHLVEDLKRSLAYMNIVDYQILLNNGTYYDHLKTRIQIKIKHMSDREKFIAHIPTRRWEDYLDEDKDEYDVRIDTTDLQTIPVRDPSHTTRSCFIQTHYGEIHRHNKSDNFLDFLLYDTPHKLEFYTVLRDIDDVLHRNTIRDYQILLNMGEYVVSYKTLIQIKLKRTDDIRKIKIRPLTRIQRDNDSPPKKTWATIVVQDKAETVGSRSEISVEYVPPHKRNVDLHSSSTT